jgi:AraC-like DNA-binding protein
MDYSKINHKILPQKNINLRFNLSDTPHHIINNGEEHKIEDAYFLGLHEEFNNLYLKVQGHVDVIGICFHADGFYPFIHMPVSEFKNQILGADESGFKSAVELCDKLKEINDTAKRLTLLEDELVKLLYRNRICIPENFRIISSALMKQENRMQLSKFARETNISIRTLERLFNMYVGMSANSYNTLLRFHNSFNQIVSCDYCRLSDLAYDNGYFDQMHFIREFKRFAGDTPKHYQKENDSILQIGKLV